MSWDWAWEVDGLDIEDVATDAFLEDEGGGSFADSPVQIPGRDGVVLDPYAPFGPMVLTLITLLRWTNSSGTVDHTNDEAGHIKENLSALKAKFGAGLVPLRRTDPDAGRQRAMVKLLTDPRKVSRRERMAYQWVLLCPSGSWQDDDTTTQTCANLVTGGDRRIFDPVVSIGAAGTLIYAALDGTTYTITASSGPTYPVTVDVGARAIVDDGDNDANDAVTFSDSRRLVLDPDRTKAITGTAASSSSVTYRNRWG